VGPLKLAPVGASEDCNTGPVVGTGPVGWFVPPRTFLVPNATKAGWGSKFRASPARTKSPCSFLRADQMRKSLGAVLAVATPLSTATLVGVPSAGAAGGTTCKTNKGPRG